MIRSDIARSEIHQPGSEPYLPPAQRSSAAICQGVRLLTAEVFLVACERVGVRRERRRMACHIRQIAMYICHVTLQMTLTAIGAGFGRDRSTVAHACHVVEDRRDNKEYDEFVSSLERIAILAFGGLELPQHE
jgi:chromosomal replication initiation ATPase DnaA